MYSGNETPIHPPTIAIAQFHTVHLDPVANYVRAADVVQRAASAGADLVIFPEFFLTGFLNAATASVKGMIEEEGVTVGRFRELARKYRIDIVPGSIVERMRLTDSVLKNTCYYIDRQGDIIGKYHKINLYPHERDLIIPGAKHQPERVFTTRWGKVGLMIGRDMMFPESARTMLQQTAGKKSIGRNGTPASHEDALIMVICPASWGVIGRQFYDVEAERIDSVCLTRACENEVAFVFCNIPGDRFGGAGPRDESSAAQDEDVLYSGRSQMCLPLSGVIARAEHDQEDLVLVPTVDLTVLKIAESVWKIREDLRDRYFRGYLNVRY